MNLDPHCREKGLHGPHVFDTGAWGRRECGGTEPAEQAPGLILLPSWPSKPCDDIEPHEPHGWDRGYGHGLAACPGRKPRRPRMATPSLLTSDHMLEALREAGIVGADENPHRVIIDLRTGHVPVIHIEKVGDERMLRLVRTLDEVRIERTPVNSERADPDPVKRWPTDDEIAANHRALNNADNPDAALPDPAVYMRSRGA